MRSSKLEGIAFLLLLVAALCADGLPGLVGPLAALGVAALAGWLVWLAHRIPREGRCKAVYYKTCPNCGAHLDPQEPCDCEREQKESRPGVITTRTANRKDKCKPIYSTPLFYRGKRRLSN